MHGNVAKLRPLDTVYGAQSKSQQSCRAAATFSLLREVGHSPLEMRQRSVLQYTRLARAFCRLSLSTPTWWALWSPNATHVGSTKRPPIQPTVAPSTTNPRYTDQPQSIHDGDPGKDYTSALNTYLPG